MSQKTSKTKFLVITLEGIQNYLENPASADPKSYISWSGGESFPQKTLKTSTGNLFNVKNRAIQDRLT